MPHLSYFQHYRVDHTIEFAFESSRSYESMNLSRHYEQMNQSRAQEPIDISRYYKPMNISSQ